MEILTNWHIVAVWAFALVLGFILGRYETKLAERPYQHWWRIALAIELLLCLTADFGVDYPWQADIFFALVLAVFSAMISYSITGIMLLVVKK